MRRFIAVDDCGTRINPMIIEGQIHGGLADGVGMALMELIAFDEEGNCLGGSFMDYLIPTALEVPDWEPASRSPRRRTTRSAPRASASRANVGSPPAIVNAIVRRARAVRRPPHRHAVHALAGLGGDAAEAAPPQ